MSVAMQQRDPRFDAAATLFACVVPLCGSLAATVVLPEVYGSDGD